MKWQVIARIIPTRMGTSFYMCSKRQVSRDHPHAYGDKDYHSSLRTNGGGSSPRVWGQDCNIRLIFFGCRIIPTRMGTSISIAASISLPRDHPHAYGDKQFLTDKTGNRRGSSPRVWGQGRIFSGELRVARIIPTRMGTR